jgi:hypothetical protein
LVKFDIVNYVSGTVEIECGSEAGTSRGANGTYYEVLHIASAGGIRLDGKIAFTGSIDNVSVTEWDGEEFYDIDTYLDFLNEWGDIGGAGSTNEGIGTFETSVNASGQRTPVWFEANRKYMVTVKGTCTSDGGWTIRTGDGGETFETFASGSFDRTFAIDLDETQLRIVLVNGGVMTFTLFSIKKISGLVVAYNMIPSPDATLVDISGNGVNGHIFAAHASDGGMKFTGKDGSRVYLSSTNILSSSKFTIAGRIKWDGSLSLTTDQVIFSNGNTTADTILDSIGIRDGISWNYDVPGTYKYRADVDLIKEKWVNFVLSVNGDRIHKIFIDGIEYPIITTSFYRSSNGSGIADRGTGVAGSNQPFAGEVGDLRIFDYAFSEQEAIDYHNSFQKLTKRGNLTADFAVGDTI